MGNKPIALLIHFAKASATSLVVVLKTETADGGLRKKEAIPLLHTTSCQRYLLLTTYCPDLHSSWLSSGFQCGSNHDKCIIDYATTKNQDG